MLSKWVVTLKPPQEPVVVFIMLAPNYETIYLFCDMYHSILLKALPLKPYRAFDPRLRLSPDHRHITYEQLAMAIRGGYTLPDALHMAGATLKIQFQLYAIHFLLTKGYTLENLMPFYENLFPNPAPAIIGAGMKAENMPSSLMYLSDFFKKQMAFHTKMKRSLHYPLIILVLLMGVMAVLQFYLQPLLETFLDQIDGSEKIAMGHGLSFFALIFVCVFVMVMGQRGSFFWVPFIERFVKSLPFLGPLIKAKAWWMTLSIYLILIKNHHDPLMAFRYLYDHTHDSFIKTDLERVLHALDRGHVFHEAIMELQTLKPPLKKLLSLGLKTGDLDLPLTSVCHLVHEDVDHYSHRFITMVEPLALIFMGGMLLTLVLSVFAPLYDHITRLHL